MTIRLKPPPWPSVKAPTPRMADQVSFADFALDPFVGRVIPVT